jgi:hypothetical protein
MDSKVATTVTVTIGAVSRKVAVSANKNFAPVKVGGFFACTGYNRIITEITGGSAGSGTVFSFTISDNLAKLSYVPDNTGNNFYWGRRGSSPTIFLSLTGAKDVSYFYSEIYVPKGFDPVGSYYQANGFG